MLIDHSKLPEIVAPNLRGGEKETIYSIYTDGLVKIMRGKLVPGATIGLHTHETNSETIYILDGTGKVLYDGAYEEVSTGSCHYCPKGHSHSLINDSEKDLYFLGLVAEHDVVPGNS